MLRVAVYTLSVLTDWKAFVKGHLLVMKQKNQQNNNKQQNNHKIQGNGALN